MIPYTNEQLTKAEEIARQAGAEFPLYYRQWSESLANRAWSNGAFALIVEAFDGDKDLAIQESGDLFALAIAAANEGEEA